MAVGFRWARSQRALAQRKRVRRSCHRFFLRNIYVPPPYLTSMGIFKGAGASILEVGGSRPPQILGKGSWGVAGGSWGGRARVVKYYYSLSCRLYGTYVRKWWLLKRNRIICPEVAVNYQCLPVKSNFLWNCLKNQNFQKFAWEKSNFLCQIAWKNRNFLKFTWRNRNCLPGSTTPRFQIPL